MSLIHLPGKGQSLEELGMQVSRSRRGRNLVWFQILLLHQVNGVGIVAPSILKVSIL